MAGSDPHGMLGLAVAATSLATVVWGLRKRACAPSGDGDAAGEGKASLARLYQSLRNLVDAGRFIGMDIGGSLAKVVFFEPDLHSHVMREARVGSKEHVEAVKRLSAFIGQSTTYGQTGVRNETLAFRSEALGGTFHFVQFETSHMEGALSLIASLGLHKGMNVIHCTGGGAHKYCGVMKERMGLRLEALDELGTLVSGMTFLLDHVSDEAYTFAPAGPPPSASGSTPALPGPIPRPVLGEQYPYLLVNVGSGVSLLLVHSPTSWTRVSGTSLGGGTFYGLCHLATGLTSFGDMLSAAEVGDNAGVDLTVGDIYGGDYTVAGLKSSTIASSFGAVMRATSGDGPTPPPPSGVRAGATAADVSRALLIMVSNNIGQLAYLCASQHDVKRIIFAGNFLRHDNTIALRRLAFAIHFWSQGAMEALFLRHEGYFGALGAFLLSLAAAPPAPLETPSSGDSALGVSQWMARGRVGSLSYLAQHPAEAAEVEAALGAPLTALAAASAGSAQ